MPTDPRSADLEAPLTGEPPAVDNSTTGQSCTALALRKMAAELRFEAEHNAKTSRDFGRGMAWAATIVASRADDAEVGLW